MRDGRGPASTGRPELDRRIAELLDEAGVSPNRDLLRRIMVSALQMAHDGADRLDLKIASSALEEMRDATRTFLPHRDRRKVTIFGSARTAADDPLYDLTRDVAARLSAHGWMVVTGAGPGIMSAGLEGAGRENALGVTIRLPFETAASDFVDPERLVEMNYFFTRKLALMRESHAFVCMPGGFGTLDESFELLTLLQTGKSTPVPIVMLGLGRGYWHAWEHFVDEVVAQGYVGDSDRLLYKITNDIDEAVDEVCGFYTNYDSMRWVGDRLVIRMLRGPDAAQLEQLNRSFASLLVSGRIDAIEALPPEVADGDRLEMARLVLRPQRRKPGQLRQLIDALNQF